MMRRIEMIGCALIVTILFAALEGYIVWQQQQTITDLNSELLGREININELQNQINILNNKISEMVLVRPTLQELQDFLTKDETSETQYVENQYGCLQFARDLKISAAQSGWNFSFVAVNFDIRIAIVSDDIVNGYRAEPKYNIFSMGHAFNMVVLSNYGIVLVEPQNDKIYSTMSELIEDLIQRNIASVHVVVVSLVIFEPAIIW